MKPAVVADAGPLIALAKLEQLMLLAHLFSPVYLPTAVHTEVTRDLTRPDAQRIQAFATTHLQLLPENNEDPWFIRFHKLLDSGEASALAAAKKYNCGVLMDERRGRRVASQQSIPTIGVLGILLQAKRQGHIESVAPFILQLQSSGYRLSPDLIRAVLQQADENR